MLFLMNLLYKRLEDKSLDLKVYPSGAFLTRKGQGMHHRDSVPILLMDFYWHHWACDYDPITGMHSSYDTLCCDLVGFKGVEIHIHLLHNLEGGLKTE
jgi:hypothetical protein